MERLEQAIRETALEWSLAEVVKALQAMRGIDLIATVAVLALSKSARVIGYLGLVPPEASTGDKVKRGGITKAGNARVGRILVEAAWAYRYPPRVGREKKSKVAAEGRRFEFCRNHQENQGVSRFLRSAKVLGNAGGTSKQPSPALAACVAPVVE